MKIVIALESWNGKTNVSSSYRDQKIKMGIHLSIYYVITAKKTHY